MSTGLGSVPRITVCGCMGEDNGLAAFLRNVEPGKVPMCNRAVDLNFV